MEFSLFCILTVVTCHFIFDFVCQSSWMATNKSKDNRALGAHVAVYSIGLFLIAFLNVGPNAGASKGVEWTNWIIFNAIAHFATDYFTSRASSKLFGKNWHNFFVVIGFDQLIHYTTLFSSIYYLLK